MSDSTASAFAAYMMNTLVELDAPKEVVNKAFQFCMSYDFDVTDIGLSNEDMDKYNLARFYVEFHDRDVWIEVVVCGSWGYHDTLTLEEAKTILKSKQAEIKRGRR